MKIRSDEDFVRRLDEEFSWRIFEIDHLHSAAHGTGTQKQSFVRAGISMLYSHWEGFIKSGAILYLEYIQSKKLTYADVTENFLAMRLQRDLERCFESRKIRPSIELVRSVVGSAFERLNIYSAAISAESNLTSEVLQNILRSIGLLDSIFATKHNLIDSKLVHYRNCVAHGERTNYTFDDFLVLKVEVVDMLRIYKTELENSALLKSYLKKK